MPMSKAECLVEMRELLEKLHGPVLIKEVGPIAARIHHLCDLLDAFEAEGK